MKILFLKDNFVFGGDVKFFYNLILPFTKSKNNTISIICNNFDEDTNELYSPIKKKCDFFFEKISLIKNIFTIYKYNLIVKIINKFLYIFLPIKITYLVFKYIKIIKSVGPDIVISCNGGYPGSHRCLAIVYASKILKISSIMIVASTPAKKKGLFYIYENLIDYFVTHSVSKIFTNSKYQKMLLYRDRNILLQKLHTIYNGIKINKKKFKKINFKKKLINLGVISRLDKEKNLDKLIKLMFFLKNEKKNYCLTVVGKGDEEENLKKIAKKLGVKSKVRFVGFVKNKHINRHLKKMDIFLFPSELEGLPYSVLEAINEGIPVISGNSGGLNEIFLNQKDILSITSVTPLKLKKCILKYVNSSSMANKLRKKAYIKLNLFFNIDKMTFLFKRNIIKLTSND